jgi:predicted DNA-binding protein (UPF0278 family)|tara:strand:- start:1329 stop:1601 length:273 start_codon:yes stop_codon:yes gene_type:complete
MTTTKKIEKEDLELIQNLREKYSEINVKLGSMATDEYIINQQLSGLQEAKQKCLTDFTSLRNDEEELIKKLREKYGDGQINIEQGTFTSL